MTIPSVIACLALSVSAVVSYGKVTESFQQTYPLAAEGSISLRNINGNIEVTTWDRDEVAVEAVKSADDAERLARMRIEVNAKPDSLSIATKLDKPSWWKRWNSNNASVQYRLKVPQRLAETQLVGVNSSITVTGVTGRLQLETVNGRISTTGSTDEIAAKTVNGSANLGFISLPASGNILVSTVNGSCQVVVPENSHYQVETKALHGSVKLADARMTRDPGVEATSTPKSGPLITLKTVNGNVSITTQ